VLGGPLAIAENNVFLVKFSDWLSL